MKSDFTKFANPKKQNNHDYTDFTNMKEVSDGRLKKGQNLKHRLFDVERE